jgi:uncharacterized protein
MNFPTKRFRLPHGFQLGEQPAAQELKAHNVIVGATTEDPNAALWLGRLAEFQRMDTNVWLDLEGAHAIYVMGKRRSGKTFTLGTLVEGLLGCDGYSTGATDQAIIVLDTMNVFLTSQLAAYRFEKSSLDQWGLPEVGKLPIDLYYPAGSPVPPTGISANPFSVPTREFTGEDWCDLFNLDPFSDPMGQLVFEALDLVSSQGFMVDGRPELPGDYDIGRLAHCIAHADELSLFDESTRRALGRRFTSLERTGLFGEATEHFCRSGRAAIFLLRDIDPELRRLLVTYITSSILRNRAATESLERVLPTLDPASPGYRETVESIADGTPRCWLIIDEAHNYIPASGGGRCRKQLYRYVTEGRNLGLSIVVATQHPSALDPALKRNADILLIHTLTMSEDIDVAQNMLTTAVPDTITLDNLPTSTRKSAVVVDAVRRLPRGFCFVSSDTVSRIVPVAVRPRVTYHGGTGY